MFGTTNHAAGAGRSRTISTLPENERAHIAAVLADIVANDLDGTTVVTRQIERKPLGAEDLSSTLARIDPGLLVRNGPPLIVSAGAALLRAAPTVA